MSWLVRFPARAWFTLAWICLVALVLVETGRLGPLAGRVPFWVALPTLALLILELALECFPSLAARLQEYQQLHLKRTESLMHRAPPGKVPGERNGAGRELSVVLWTLSLPVAILLLGFVAGASLFVIFSLRIRAGLAWWKAALCGGTTGLLLFVISRTLLQTPLYTGWLW